MTRKERRTIASTTCCGAVSRPRQPPGRRSPATPAKTGEAAVGPRQRRETLPQRGTLSAIGYQKAFTVAPLTLAPNPSPLARISHHWNRKGLSPVA
jgi:hypothetical protein